MGIMTVGAASVLVAAALVPGALSTGGEARSAPNPRTIASRTVGPGCADWGSSSVALPSPQRDVGKVSQAGVVELRYRVGSSWQKRVLTSADLGVPDQVNGHFGASVAVARPGPTCAGLAIGMPGAAQGRGAVVVIPDYGEGLDLSAAVWLSTSALSLAPGDHLGQALASGPTSCCEGGKGWTLIVAGAPGRDLPGAPNAGEVVSWRIPWSASEAAHDPLAPEPAVTYVQGQGGMRGAAEAGDHFGSVLGEDNGPVVVGIPDEAIGSKADAGAIAVLRFTGAGVLGSNDLLWQGSGLPGKSRSGDRLGAAVLGQNYGIPGKDADGKKNSGAALFWNAEANRYDVITQDTKGIAGVSEAGDAFGSALAGYLLIGAPGEDIGGKKDVGAVTYKFPSSFQQRVRGLAAGDRFGSTIIAQAYECGADGETMCRLNFFGAPGEDRPGARNAGRYYLAVNPRKTTLAQVFADGVVAGERFGSVVSAVPPPP